MKKRQKDYYRIRREAWIHLQGSKCNVCGKSHPPEMLDIDHIDPTLKTGNKMWAWSEERRQKELENCQVLCTRCHREKSNRFIGAVVLTEEQEAEWDRLVAEGFGRHRLAALFGMPPSTVRDKLTRERKRGKNWL